MENELVKEFKKSCSIFDNELREYYDEVVERGALEEDIDYLIGLMYDLNGLRGTTKDSLKTSTILFNDIKKRFAIKRDEIEEYLGEKEAEDNEVVDAEYYEAKNSTKSKAGRVIASILGLSFLAGTTIHTGLLLKNKCNNAKSEEETVEETESERDIIIDNETESKEESTTEEKETSKEESKEESTTEKQLVLGEYGTFLDASDEEQVQARAQYLYDNYYSKNMKYIDEGDRHLVTVENIANTIRVMNGELPLDENGYQTKDGATVDDYTSVLLAMTVNAGSTKGEDYYHFPAYLLAEDGSEVSEFIKSYDDIYDKLVYSMNVGDDEQAQDAIACLGYKFWNEWYLQGMNGDVNPHTFDADLRYFAFVSTIEPFNTTALEYHLNEKEPVCIEACYDYETKDKQLLTVNEIHTALETGAWNQIGAKLAGMEVPNNPWLPLFWEELDDQLNWKYDHREVKTLK